ncbi:Uncharacterised protein g5573 [Pycnogonum litorale]
MEDGKQENRTVTGSIQDISSRRKISTTDLRLKIDPETEYYSMSNKSTGVALIINNKQFAPHTYLAPRSNSESDVTALIETFRQLGFITVNYENIPAREMIRVITKIGSKSHENADCFICCILTYGDMSFVYGTDGKFRNDEIFTPFLGDNCPTLAGKPKIFLLQTYNETRIKRKSDHDDEDCYDKGSTEIRHKLKSDSPCGTCKIPVHADFLIAFKSDKKNWNEDSSDTHGTPSIQTLCQTILQSRHRTDFLNMFTECNRRLCSMMTETRQQYDFKAQPDTYVISVTSTLTKKILFTKSR